MSRKVRIRLVLILLAALMLTAAGCIVWAHCPPVSIPNEYSDFIEDDEIAELRRSALKFNRSFSFPVRITILSADESRVYAHADYASGRVGLNIE
ncbi:MAG: hypothetical protein ACI4T6_09135, partial [Candidatus Flemingiibacterium sp.]